MKRKLIGLGAFAVALALLGVAWLKAQNGFSARDEPSALERAVAQTMRAMSVPSSAKAMKSPRAIDDRALADARMHWADHCALCHANDGSGATPIGKGLFPRSPDMRTAATQEKSDGELFFIIENGVRLTGMPAWGVDGTHADESWALVAFIRQLPSLKPEELKAMEKMNPRSAHESIEAQEEDAFLHGESP